MPVEVPLIYENVYGVSPEVSIRVVAPELGPWLVTFRVTDFLTHKPIEGATVQVNGTVGTTASDGTVTLTIEGGTRRIIVSKSGYWTKAGTRLITEDTTIDVSLVPIWAIVAGAVGGSLVLLAIGLALARR